MSPFLLVGDIDRSIQFYTRTLGFNVDFRYEDFYSGIIRDGCSIHLKVGTPSTEDRENRRNSEDPDIIFSVEGIGILYEELSNRSVDFIQSLRDMPYGKEFYVADPDGNVIAFLEEA